MMDQVLAGHDRIDILVNGAAAPFAGPLETMPADRCDQDIAVNLSASFHTCRRVLPGMRRRDWGRIVNVASSPGLVGSGYKAAYVAAKHGLVGFTKALGLEWQRRGSRSMQSAPDGW